MTPEDDCGELTRLVELVRESAAARQSPSANDRNLDAHKVDRGMVESLISQQHLMLSPHTRELLIDQVIDETVGAGPLAPLLRQPGVTDVLVNAPDRVYVDSGAGLQRVAVAFADERAVRECAQRLARAANRRLDDAHPFVDARLPTGERLHAVLPPISRLGTTMSIRVPSSGLIGWRDIADTTRADIAQTVLESLRARTSILVTGGTGSGKTTLVNALLGECDPRDRIIVVEDTSELSPDHPHVVRLESRFANADGAGEVSMSNLVRQALRMRPDRVVVGEVRGVEVEDLLRALNTGHTGSLATMHANTPADVPARIELLAAACGLSAEGLHASIAAAFGLVVHMQRDARGRRHIADVARVELVDGRARVTSC